jgi:hypothetical protein
MPWKARSKSDRKRLEGLELTAEHFPFVHRLSAKAMAAIEGATKAVAQRNSKGGQTKGQQADAKPVTQTSTAKNREQTGILQDDSSPEPKSEDRAEYFMDSQGQTEDLEEPQPDPETEEEKLARELAEQQALEQAEDEWAQKLTFKDSFRDRVRAGLNMYGPHLIGIGAGGEEWCTASAAAMKKYCRIYDEGNHPQDIDLADYNSLIVRAFVNAISPCPGEGLPRHDYEFPKKAQGANSPDLLGVTAEETVKIIEHNWTMKTLSRMYELACIMRCTVVKDQVVDQLCDNYAKHLNPIPSPTLTSTWRG